MAGSQLKNLKATLKAHGLTGQTNTKHTKKTKRQAREYDREEKAKTIAKIREQFNPFEVKAAKNKRKGGDPGLKNSDKVAVGKPGISKQIGEEQRMKAFEAKRLMKKRKGGVIDKRFGERDKNLTEEEKMLERFTRERQSTSSKKKDLFNLEDDEDEGHFESDMFGNKLTHLGASLGDDFNLQDEVEDDLDQPPRKKTKAEVMKEIIAKSKFHKHERQEAQRKMEDNIDELDDDFEDVMAELMTTQPTKKKEEEVGENEKDYDIKVKELLMEKRAAPADRTKTEEELQKEADEKRQQLEEQRLNRMKGMVEDEEGEEKGVEDLDDGFWGSDSENEDADEIANSDDDVDFNVDSAGNESHKPRKKLAISCPQSQEEMLNELKGTPLIDQPSHIKDIIKAYQPKLAEGNKEKLAQFSKILLRYMIFLANQKYDSDIETFDKTQDQFLSILKKLSEKYNQAISEECRSYITNIQARFKKFNFSAFSTGDILFFLIVGILFSTSDQYHLVGTPAQILLSEFLEQIRFKSTKRIAVGAIIMRLIIKYQRLPRRYVPEITYFIQKSLISLLIKEKDIDSDFPLPIRLDSFELGITSKDPVLPEQGIIHLHELFSKDNIDEEKLKLNILANIFEDLDKMLGNYWNDKAAFTELCDTIQPILKIYSERYPNISTVTKIIEKLQRMKKLNTHYPLTLQAHRPTAIPSYAPKFEENFNPEKKSYDTDATRNEVNRMKAQLKKERKFTMKELRKDTKFEARQRIDEKRKEAEVYHAKMSNIINTINTEEGAEKNKYEREKRLRAGKK
ncbi:Nucleolar complex protein 14 [Nakaseomyces bracarensis]|uniref:Nucleolar complex protein 14 n=1 Tax=Nakaseomyces bracarensis TaxID=273131 RepID=A0ABR4NPZ5_9SACH